MGQRYEGTLIVQTPDANSPTGTYNLTYQYPEATEEQIFNGCTAFNSNGKRIVGNARGGADNPIICKTEQEMTSLLTTDNVGKFVRFEGGNPEYAPITEGTAVNNVFFNTAVVPDFDELFDSSDADKLYLEGDSGSCAIVQLGRDQDSISESKTFQAIRQVSGGVTLTAIAYLGYSFAYINCIPEDAFSPSDMGVEHWGWQVDRIPEDVISSYRSYNYYNVNSNQTVWGKYISQRLAFAAPYTYGQVYTIVESESALSYKPVYALDKLSNKATADTVLEGFSAYDETGKVITGAALKNNDAAFIARSLTSVSAKSMRGITSIGDYAFAGCSSLTSVEIGKDITNVGRYVFLNTPSTLEITWEEESAGNNIMFAPHAYSGYSNTSVVIPARVTNIQNSCFDNTLYLKDVHISDLNRWMNISFYDWWSNPLYHPDITDGGNLYVNDELLTKLDLSDTDFTEINRYCFAGARCLTEVILPKSSLTKISAGAFGSCTALEKVVLPENTDQLFFAGDSFANDSALKEVDTHNIETWYAANPEDIGNYPSYALLANNEEVSHITFNGVEPSGVISIAQNIPARTYQNCKNITGIQIEDSGNFYIREKAFYNCTGLGPQVNVGNLNAGPYSFKNCTSLQILTTSNSTAIYDYAFEGCTSLKQLNLASGSVGMGAFKNCSALEKITSSGILRCYSQEGDGSSFEGCSNVKEIDGDLSIIGALPDRTKLQSVSVSYSGSNGSRVNINDNFFKNATTLHTFAVNGAAKLQRIGVSAFEGCTSLSSVTFVSSYDDSSVQFSDFAFKNCTALTSLEIPLCPRGLILGHEALAIGTSDNKATITLKNTAVPSIQSDTFDTSKLEKIVVPAGKKAQYIQNTVWKTLENYIEEAVN